MYFGWDSVRRLGGKLDWWLTAGIVVLLIIGLLLHYSLAIGGENTAWQNFSRQVFFVALSVMVFTIFAHWDYRFFRGNNLWWFLIGLALLIGVLLFGQTIRGTTGWFRLGPVQLQPVEFVKVLVIVVLANYFSRHARQVKEWRYLIWSGLGVWTLIVLVVLQPDLGSAMIFLLTWLGMLMLMRLRWSQVLIVLGMVTLLSVLTWQFALQDYQKERLMVFWQPDRDPLGEGYNVRQAMIAVGSGRWIGRGLGFGSQSHLRFLPEARTDFIFAVLAEELGFLGVGLVLFVWFILIGRLVYLAGHSRDDFAVFILVGTSVMLTIEVAINVGMNMGLSPVTGIALPFLSYGGSSLLATMILVGLAQSIAWRQKSLN